MKSQLITDNITDLLVKIIEFTEERQKILTRNINNIDKKDFIPEDLATAEFSKLMNNAINEHISNNRLVLYDTETIKFGIGGSLDIKATPDGNAEKILRQNREQYLEMQINKLMENALNQKIAAVLLKQKKQSAEDGLSYT